MSDGAPECQKCHRPLRDAVSIARGHGPDCWAALQGKPRPPRGARHAGVIDRHIEPLFDAIPELEG